VAIARAAVCEGLDVLPIAELQRPERDARLLVDHLERLIGQRIASIKTCAGSCTTCGPSSRSGVARHARKRPRCIGVKLAPRLLAERGCGLVAVAKLIGEIAVSDTTDGGPDCPRGAARPSPRIGWRSHTGRRR
jgi:hypothetical protein